MNEKDLLERAKENLKAYRKRLKQKRQANKPSSEEAEKAGKQSTALLIKYTL